MEEGTTRHEALSMMHDGLRYKVFQPEATGGCGEVRILCGALILDEDHHHPTDGLSSSSKSYITYPFALVLTLR